MKVVGSGVGSRSGAGSSSGSIDQRYGSGDPDSDPHQMSRIPNTERYSLKITMVHVHNTYVWYIQDIRICREKLEVPCVMYVSSIQT
jgi:hypothetical protein